MKLIELIVDIIKWGSIVFAGLIVWYVLMKLAAQAFKDTFLNSKNKENGEKEEE